MNEQLLTRLKQEIQSQYIQKYGAVSIEFDELVPEDEHTVRVTFTILKDQSFVTRYYGTATYLNNRLHMDGVTV